MAREKISESINKVDNRKQSVIVAMLLFRFIRSDGTAKMIELLHMSEILRKDFRLSQSELEEVFKLANEPDSSSNKNDDILTLVKENWSYQSRKTLLKYLWILAFSDDNIDDNEVRIIKEVAERFEISNIDQSRSQQRAEEHLGL